MCVHCFTGQGSSSKVAADSVDGRALVFRTDDGWERLEGGGERIVPGREGGERLIGEGERLP